MPRPRKWRRVCNLPVNNSFGPLDNSKMIDDCIVMTVDEYETIRLIDLEGLSQEDCGIAMNIGRTTAQRIYNNGKKKLATSLVKGIPLKIEGGEYEICSEREENCGNGKGRCRRMHRGHNRHL